MIQTVKKMVFVPFFAIHILACVKKTVEPQKPVAPKEAKLFIPDNEDLIELGRLGLIAKTPSGLYKLYNKQGLLLAESKDMSYLKNQDGNMVLKNLITFQAIEPLNGNMVWVVRKVKADGSGLEKASYIDFFWDKPMLIEIQAKQKYVLYQKFNKRIQSEDGQVGYYPSGNLHVLSLVGNLAWTGEYYLGVRHSILPSNRWVSFGKDDELRYFYTSAQYFQSPEIYQDYLHSALYGLTVGEYYVKLYDPRSGELDAYVSINTGYKFDEEVK